MSDSEKSSLEDEFNFSQSSNDSTMNKSSIQEVNRIGRTQERDQLIVLPPQIYFLQFQMNFHQENLQKK